MSNAVGKRSRGLASLVVVSVLLAVVGVVFRGPLVAWFSGERSHPAVPPAPSSGTAPGQSSSIEYYTCPMHPSVRAHAPGKCPICGMDLVGVTSEQVSEGVVFIDEARRQLIGVRTGPVVRAPMRSTVRAVGQVTYDESKLSDVNLKVQGWITKLYVNETGQRVALGQPLLSLYSPELYAAEQDFLLSTQGNAATSAGSSAGVERLARAARQRLHLLGLGDAQIDGIQKSGAPLENITITAPAAGFVIEKSVVEGASVEPGMRLFRIAALGRVWVEVDVYEGDLPHVQVGQSAMVTLDYIPGRIYEAKVAYVYPYLDPKTRAGRVRVELDNGKLELRPGMYATAELSSDGGPRLQVPASAVVYTGPRRLVFVDLGGGRFRPQEIRVGAHADDVYEVVDGLHEGDVVATSGVFLIAAEARISTATKYWDESGLAPLSAPRSPSSTEGGSTSSDVGRANDPPRSASFRPGARSPAPPSSGPSAPPAPRVAPAGSPAPSSAPTLYTCPMHPEVRSPAPGRCPICGMDLVRAPGGGSK